MRSLAASTDVFRSSRRLKLPSCVRDVGQLVRAPNGTRDCDRKSGPSGMRQRSQGIPISIHTGELLELVRISSLDQQKRSCRLFLYIFRCAPKQTYHHYEHNLRNIQGNQKYEYYFIAYDHPKLCNVLDILISHTFLVHDHEVAFFACTLI